MKPYRPKPLPLSDLDWEKFVDLLGPAHVAIARFALTKGVRSLKEELRAQRPKTRNEYKKMLAFSAKSRGISSKLLCKMYRMLSPGSPAEFRNKQNWIGPEGCSMKEGYFYPPLPELVAKSMKNLERYYKSRKEKDPLVHLAIYFAELLIIHPFMDMNGRIARAIIPLFLYKKGLTPKPNFYMSAYFKQRRLKYFKQLYQITAENDWEGWIRFFLQGIILSVH